MSTYDFSKMSNAEVVEETIRCTQLDHSFEAAERSWNPETPLRSSNKARLRALWSECRKRGIPSDDIFVPFF